MNVKLLRSECFPQLRDGARSQRAPEAFKEMKSSAVCETALVEAPKTRNKISLATFDAPEPLPAVHNSACRG
jgi:hypothetical protein